MLTDTTQDKVFLKGGHKEETQETQLGLVQKGSFGAVGILPSAYDSAQSCLAPALPSAALQRWLVSWQKTPWPRYLG